MSEPALPKQRQPDAVSDHVLASAPSLLVYLSLVSLAIVLIVLAFWLDADWPSLFISLAASLIAAVVILVFVDRRLRRGEIQQIRRFPKQLGYRSLLIISSKHRQFHRYMRSYLATLDTVLELKVTPSDFGELLEKGESGFLLLGAPGTGKTTRLQMLTAHWAREFIDTPTKKVPVLFPLRRWLSDRSLEEAIFEHINGFAAVSRKSFRRTLSKGNAIIILDSVDDLFMRSGVSFSNAFPELRAKYETVSWIVSSRPDMPDPVKDLPRTELSPLSSEEMREIARSREL